MVGKYLTKKANSTKKVIVSVTHIAVSCAGGYLTYRTVSFFKDRMLGIGAGIIVTILVKKRLS